MFGNLMGDMEAHKAEMDAKLEALSLEAEAGNGSVRVQVNGKGVLQNISIAPDQLSSGETEELEDLLLIAVNRALELANEEEAKASEALINNIMPPGMQGLFGE